MKPTSGLGLRGRLLLILLLAFVVLSGLVAWQSLAERDALAEVATERLLNHARLIAARQQSLIDRGDALLNSLMVTPALKGGSVQPPCAGLLAERLKPEPAFFQIGKVAPNGDLLCIAVPGRPGVNLADRAWFRQALQTPEMVVSEVMTGRILGRQVIVLGKAMRDAAGQVQAVFFLAIGLDWLHQEWAKAGLSAGARLLVVDGRGQLVFVHPDPAALGGRNFADHPLVKRILAVDGEGVAAAEGLDEVPRLIAHTPLLKAASGHPYHLWLSLPRDQVEAPAQRQLLIRLAIALLVLAGTLGLLYWADERHLVRPLRILSRTAQGYGSGDPEGRSGPPRAGGEIGIIRQSLETMAAALQASTVSGQHLLNEIHDHRLMQEQLQRSQILLDQAMRIARLGAWSIELREAECFERNPVTWSAEMYRLLDYTPEEVPIPRPELYFARVHPEDCPALVEAATQALAEKRSWQINYRFIHADGSEHFMRESGEFLFDEAGNPLSMHGAVQDLTAHKQAKARLHELTATLEERVRQRTAELMAVNQELEGFTYAASHDMKGPLGRINSFGTLLSQRYRGQLEGDGLFFIDLIQQNATRLNALIDDLLAHARIGQEALELQPVDLQGVIQKILHERMGDIRHGGATLRLDLPGSLIVLGHPFVLAQALGNLVENALKYSSQSPSPVVEIGARLAEGRCRLWVRDNGIGIDPAYQERIFEIFRRLHTYNEYPGTGVGLALVKKAVERLNGRVWVESEPGQGATFYVELPA